MANGLLAGVGRRVGLADAPTQAVLVVTDTLNHGHNGLDLPFRDAFVVAVGSDPAELVFDVDGIDTAVIDRHSLDLAWLAAAVAKISPALGPGGRIVVVFDPTGPVADGSGPADFGGLSWWGLESLNGRPCAVLGVAEDGPQAGAAVGQLLLTADRAVRLAARDTAATSTHLARDLVRNVFAAHLEQRRRSEQALLRHLDTVAKALDAQRRANTPRARASAILRRSVAGRVVLRVAQRGRRAAARVRTGIRGARR